MGQFSITFVGFTPSFPVSIVQDKEGMFTVIYGQQVTAGLDYEQACKNLGQCIMHNAACESLIEA